jgi:hypothetical protein
MSLKPENRETFMQNTAGHSPLSASQEISLMTRARKLNRLITSMGFQLPLRLLAYDCMDDLSPLGMVLLGYEVHAVNSDPTQQPEEYFGESNSLLTCGSYPLLELGEHVNQVFDVVLINGVVFTEVRADSQLQEVCQQLAAAIRPDGLLLISSADFDEILRARERVLRPQITDDDSGRHLHCVVRDWHGNGYEYTETRYIIEDGNGRPTVTHRRHQHRAWRCAEITLELTRAGLQDFQWQTDKQNHRIMIARKHSSNPSN